MTEDVGQRAHAIFVEALERDEDEREAFVSSACERGTPLDDAVRRLLSAVSQTATFLERPVVVLGESWAPKVSPAAAPEPPPLPLRVPGHTILRTIGAGGMATVYEAEQERPHRTVALKVMRQDLGESSARQRFLFEAEILAALKHPGIAQIYEAGAIEDDAGRSLPFFSMELVEDARPLTAYAQERGLTLSERIGMFLGVCEAVSFGHEAGVIHRDLKPSNLLVGADGRARIIDFGIARSLSSHDPRLTLDTDRDRLMGTLNYMSPEQCTETDRVDTRSDVYALGVILYELATGQLPHDLSSAPLPEAIRRKQTSPPRPSSLEPAVRGDLEAIILTAMDAERERRYPTAAGLADDVRRFLAKQPVQARPLTTLYQIRKFTQRNRPLVAGAAGVVVALLGGIIATTIVAIAANEARRAEEARSAELARVVEFQRAQLSDVDVPALGERLRTELGGRLTDEGAPAAAHAALDDVNFTSLALVALDEAILDRSREAIDEQFPDQPLLRARLLVTLAQTTNQLGMPAEAEAPLAEAMRIRRELLGEDHPDTELCKHAMGFLLSTLGRYDEAAPLIREAYELRVQRLGVDDPETLKSANQLGGVLRRLGRLEEANSVWEHALEASRRTQGDDATGTLILLSNVGITRAMLGDAEGAERAWREFLDRQRRLLGEDDPAYQSILTNLALLLWDQGRLSETREMLETALAALQRTKGDEHPSTANTMSSLASLLAEQGEHERAVAYFEESLAVRERVLGPEHPDTWRSRANYASYRAADGGDEGAFATLEEVLEAQTDALGGTHPHTVETVRQMVEALIASERFEEARAAADRAVRRAHGDEAVDIHPVLRQARDRAHAAGADAEG